MSQPNGIVGGGLRGPLPRASRAPSPSPFRALSLSFDLIEALSSVIPSVKKHDAGLADQLRRAAQSVALRSKRNRAWRSGRQSAELHDSARLSSPRVSAAAMNLAESTGNKRGNRRLRIESAFGSAQETKAALHIARCWYRIDDAEARRSFELADTIARMCWGLTR